MPASAKETFHFVLIKPSHYDDDGYPIQWWRSIIPSNTLATVNGLVLDSIEREVLGPDVEIRIQAHDETNTRIRPDRIIRDLKKAGGKALIGFAGVQTNQFPRSIDLAKPFLDAGYPVAIGGFHVSGCIAMLPELPQEIVDAQKMGITVFAGECEEHRMDEIIRDAYNGTLKPQYNYMNALPSLDGEPVPFLSKKTIDRTIDNWTSFDMGRGCPYQCSFCTIINVQGRKSRFRSPDDLERIVRKNAAQGVHKFFITDDNFARNKDWEAMLDRLIHLRKTEGLKCKLIIQVDTLCHKIPNFIEKATKAGAKRVFIGLENVNPDNLLAIKKRQNKITEYRLMLQKWREHGATIYTGYIIGLPNDTKETLLRDIEIIKNELPIDLVEFLLLTPLPGSEDHKRELAQGRWMDPDLNKYDLYHRTTHHPKMSDEEWEEAYDAVWHSFYSKEHRETILRRTAAMEHAKVHRKAGFLLEFYSIYNLEKLHPVEGGILRKKYRRDRRPGMPIESPFVFYPRHWFNTASKAVRLSWMIFEAWRMSRRIENDPKRYEYTDNAISPPTDEDLENLALFQETTGGTIAVQRQLKTERIIEEVQAKVA